MMRAPALLLAMAIGLTACGPGKGVDPSQYAKLPPQDTLAGGLAPAPSTATGGGAATPANPIEPPATGGNTLTWASTPPAPPPAPGAAQAGAAPGATGPTGAAAPGTATPTAGAAATGAGAGAGGRTQPGAGGHVPTGTGPAGVKR